MDPDDYVRWGRGWRRTGRAAAVATAAVLAVAVAYRLASGLAPT